MLGLANISVVVPTLDEADGIGALVAQLIRDGFGEVIVADGGSTDGTPDLAAAAGAATLASARGRASQMNAGAAAAIGEIPLFLHADTRLPEGAADLMLQTMADQRVSAGCFRLRFDQPHPLLNLYAWCSRFETFATTFGDQAFFVRGESFKAVGGFPEQPLMEDVEFRRGLKTVGRFVKLPTSVTTSARRFRQDGLLRRQLANAVLLSAYALGVSPTHLKKFYR